QTSALIRANRRPQIAGIVGKEEEGLDRSSVVEDAEDRQKSLRDVPDPARLLPCVVQAAGWPRHSARLKVGYDWRRSWMFARPVHDRCFLINPCDTARYCRLGSENVARRDDKSYPIQQHIRRPFCACGLPAGC